LADAIEATSPGAGEAVTCEGAAPARKALIEVDDDGPGLSSPDAPIFDAFFSTKPPGHRPSVSPHRRTRYS